MLSLSGSPPASSFQFHDEMSIASLEPPPVKIVLLPEPSATNAWATELPPPGVFQSSPATFGSSIAFPSSSKTPMWRSEEHTSELQSRENLVCRLLLEKKKKKNTNV